MKYVIAMDSFKGSMSSLEAGEAVRSAIKEMNRNDEIYTFEVADGGEGTAKALVNALISNGEQVTRKELLVTGPLGTKVMAEYYIYEKQEEKIAILEMASAAGLTLVPADMRNPMNTTTYGVGELIKDALDKKCNRFVVGIGGSSTNDCGIGMLQALGYRFVDAKGEDVGYGAKGLGMIADIYPEDAHPGLSGASFTIACDVDNPLVGERGCSRVFAPQKGADLDMVLSMESSMNRFASLVEHMGACDENPLHRKNRKIGLYNREYPGTGAAGGLGFAFLMFTDAVLESGVEILLEETGIREHIQNADFVITGEGSFDAQSMAGKVPVGVARVAKYFKVPCYVFAGKVQESDETRDLFAGCYGIKKEGQTLAEAMEIDTARNNLKDKVKQVFSLLS